MNIVRFIIISSIILAGVWVGLTLGHVIATRQHQIERQIEQQYEVNN